LLFLKGGAQSTGYALCSVSDNEFSVNPPPHNYTEGQCSAAAYLCVFIGVHDVNEGVYDVNEGVYDVNEGVYDVNEGDDQQK